MVDDTALMGLALKAYEVATAPDQWPVLLEGVRSQFGATSSLIFTPGEANTHERFLFSSAGLDLDAQVEYGRDWATKDPWLMEALERRLPLVNGAMFIGESYLPLTRLKKTEFYNEYGVRNDLESIATLIITEGRDADLEPKTYMSLLRGPGLPGFTPDELRGYQALHPHLNRALRSYWAFAGVRRESRAVEETLDAIPQPLLVLRRNGTVDHANPAARALLANDSPVRVCGNHIQRIGQLDLTRLAGAMQLTALGAAQTLSTWFEDKGRSRSVVLRFTPVQRDHAMRMRWPAAEVMLLVELVSTALHRPTLLQAVAHSCQFTSAETSLLEQLVAGATLGEAAQHQQVRISTARTHLAHMLAKSGARRQSDLMRLVSL